MASTPMNSTAVAPVAEQHEMDLLEEEFLPSLPLPSNRHPFRTDGVEFDSDGFPIMPADLAEFQSLRLDGSKESERKAAQEAIKVYMLWQENDWKPIRIDPPEGAALSCHSDDSSDFDGEYPEEEDYQIDVLVNGEMESILDQQAYVRDTMLADIAMARAKKACWSCPVREQCLASSLTLPHRTRQQTFDPDRVDMDEYGVYGGWGPSARTNIFHKMVTIWSAEAEAGRA